MVEQNSESSQQHPDLMQSQTSSAEEKQSILHTAFNMDQDSFAVAMTSGF